MRHDFRISETLSLNFLSSPFVISVNLLHPWPSLFLYGSLLLPVLCFSILVSYCFQVVQLRGSFVRGQYNLKAT